MQHDTQEEQDFTVPLSIQNISDDLKSKVPQNLVEEAQQYLHLITEESGEFKESSEAGNRIDSNTYPKNEGVFASFGSKIDVKNQV